MDGAANHAPFGPRLVLRGSYPAVLLRRRVEEGVAQTEWSGDALGYQRVQRLTRHPFHQHAQADHVEVGVGVAGAGRFLKGGGVDRRQPRGVVRERVQVQPRCHAGLVGEQLPYRDGRLGRIVGGELRQVLCHGRVEREGTLLGELHRHCGGEQLRDRGQVEEGVLRHGNPLFAGKLDGLLPLLVPTGVPQRVPESLMGHDDAVPRREDHAAGERGRRAVGAGREERLSLFGDPGDVLG